VVAVLRVVVEALAAVVPRTVVVAASAAVAHRTAAEVLAVVAAAVGVPTVAAVVEVVAATNKRRIRSACVLCNKPCVALDLRHGAFTLNAGRKQTGAYEKDTILPETPVTSGRDCTILALADSNVH
jgi:hypothetical protein